MSCFSQSTSSSCSSSLIGFMDYTRCCMLESVVQQSYLRWSNAFLNNCQPFLAFSLILLCLFKFFIWYLQTSHKFNTISMRMLWYFISFSNVLTSSSCSSSSKVLSTGFEFYVFVYSYLFMRDQLVVECVLRCFSLGSVICLARRRYFSAK